MNWRALLSWLRQRAVVAAGYAVGITATAVAAGGVPTDQEKWLALLGVFVWAFWAKFSSSQTVIAANRPEWTPEQRAANAGK
jgi:hypothetical protein